MRARPPIQPRKLDIKTFIDSGESLTSTANLSDWARLAANLAEGVSPADVPALSWTALGRQVPRRTGGPERWLDLSVSGRMPLTCQRCLHPVNWTVQLQHSLRFVDDENTAAELDADLDDDVLALSRHLDLLELLEDELIMGAPLVPRHDECPEDVDAWMYDDAEVTPDGQVVRPDEAPADAVAEAADDRKPNPFSALAALKKKQD
jgi:uncharacterized protein